MKMLLMPTTALMLLTGCTQAPAPAPPDTRAADEQAIRDQEAAAQQAWAAKDTDKVASLYADDATVMLPDTPVMTGKAAISAAFKGAGSDPNFSLSLQTTSVDTSKGGDLGYIQGILHGASERSQNQESHHGEGQLRPGVQEAGRRLLEDRGRYGHPRSARHADRQVGTRNGRSLPKLVGLR